MTFTMRHGAALLPAVQVDSYNEEIKDGDGFVGDKASSRAFRALVDEVRERARAGGPDPLGTEPASAMRKSQLDRMLVSGTPEQEAVMHTAVELFAHRLAFVLQRFLALPSWDGTQRVVVGGGMSDSRAGVLAIGRAQLLLKEAGKPIDLRPIRHHPDEAGLLGGMQLAPAWVFKGHDCIVALDVGGSNIRAGLVVLHAKAAADGSRAAVEGLEHWRHRDEKPTRAEVMERMVGMIRRLCRRAEREGHALAPFIALGCPGVIAEDGQIERGGQNLPGDWEQDHFNLPELIQSAVPRIAGHRTHVAMHNDAVVQGLSEVPFQRDVRHWGVITVGTGLGNARFTNRADW